MFTPVQLDKARNLRYGMAAINRIEKALGTTMGKLDLDNLSMEHLATIIWAGLVHEDKELTVDGVMDLIDNHSSINEISEIMGKAFGDAFGKGDGSKN